MNMLWAKEYSRIKMYEIETN